MTKQSNRSSHQVNLSGKTASAAIGEATNAHKAGRGLKVKSQGAGYDATTGPLADKAEAYFEENLDEPDDLAFEGAKVARDPETGRFIRAPDAQESGADPLEFLKNGEGSTDQEAAVRAGFERAARAKGWRVG